MRWMALALLAVLGCGSGPGRGPGGDRPGQGGDRPEPATIVEVVGATTGEVAETLVTSAVVESEAQADLYPQAAGTVQEIRVDEGDPVREGQVLAVIDNATLGAGAERAAADLARLEREHAEMQALHRKGAVSDRDLEDLAHQLATARTSAREAAATFGHTRITAPFDGVVAIRELREGEYAASTGRAFQVVDLDRLRVVAQLPERDVSRVREGQPARLVSAYDPLVAATGTVERISPVIDPQTGTFRVTVALPPEQRALRPGQFVSVEIEVDRHEGVLVVPRTAVVWEDGDPVAYVMVPEPPGEEEESSSDEDEDGDRGGLSLPSWLGGGDDEEPEDAPVQDVPRYVAQRASLELGLVDGTLAEVRGGLERGDQVIVVGQSNLRDGAAVLTPEMHALAEARREAAEDEESEEDGSGEDG